MFSGTCLEVSGPPGSTCTAESQGGRAASEPTQATASEHPGRRVGSQSVWGMTVPRHRDLHSEKPGSRPLLLPTGWGWGGSGHGPALAGPGAFTQRALSLLGRRPRPSVRHRPRAVSQAERAREGREASGGTREPGPPRAWGAVLLLTSPSRPDTASERVHVCSPVTWRGPLGRLPAASAGQPAACLPRPPLRGCFSLLACTNLIFSA